MSFNPNDENGEAQKKDTATETLKYLKVIAYLLAEMQDENLTQLLNDIEEI